MARTGGEALSAFYVGEHRAKGVDIRLSCPPKAFEGTKAVEAVALADGSRLPADLVVVGVGATPAMEIAAAAGIECADGVVADASGRTSDPHVFAIGDCASSMSPLYGRRMRLESVQNAIDGAKAAAAAIAGKPAPHVAAPWNWSDQYDLKLQIAGVSGPGAEYLMRGDPANGAFSCLHLQDGRLVAIDAINRGADFLAAKALIRAAVPIDPARAADPEVKLSDLAGAQES
jgi:3-phenylpropionate/trans-cinnamate dioxygenase ferredoxin reductase subunit